MKTKVCYTFFVFSLLTTSCGSYQMASQEETTKTSGDALSKQEETHTAKARGKRGGFQLLPPDAHDRLTCDAQGCNILIQHTVKTDSENSAISSVFACFTPVGSKDEKISQKTPTSSSAAQTEINGNSTPPSSVPNESPCSESDSFLTLKAVDKDIYEARTKLVPGFYFLSLGERLADGSGGATGGVIEVKAGNQKIISEVSYAFKDVVEKCKLNPEGFCDGTSDPNIPGSSELPNSHTPSPSSYVSQPKGDSSNSSK